MNSLNIEVYETSESGNQLTEVEEFTPAETNISVTLDPSETFQEITGFGGSFTESSAYLLNQLSEENRNRILEAYFGESGARYSLT
jgi:glucosylceramidase